MNNTKEANGHGMIVSEIGKQRNFLRKIHLRNKSINLAIVKDQWHSNIRNLNKNVQCKNGNPRVYHNEVYSNKFIEENLKLCRKRNII